MGGWVDNEGRNMHTVPIPMTGPDNPNHHGSVLAVIMVDKNGSPVDLSQIGSGGSGTGGPTQFIHVQSISSETWVINHKLNKAYPTVVVVDQNGEEGIPDINSVDENNLELLFSVPFSGTAYLS